MGWRTTDFEELYGDLGECTMKEELAREVSGFIYRVTVKFDASNYSESVAVEYLFGIGGRVL